MLSSLLKKTTKNIIHDKFEINGGVYVEDALIGEGAYAYVYRVKDSHGKAFALKKLICQTDDQIKETKKEIKLLALIKHSNVLSLLDSSFHMNSKKQTEAFLLLPLYGKSAQDIIDQGPGYPHCAFELRSQVLKMLVQCIDAINAIHSSGYTHCDFKPANVLLDDNMNAIVTDFGSACPLTTEVTSRSQALSVQDHAASNTTASFRPPELFDTPSHCTIDGKVDVWGLGCTLFALMFSRTPFENPAEGGLSVLAVLSSTFTFPETCEWPPEYYTLIKASLRSDCSARLSIDELKILAGLLPNPDISEVTGAFGSPPVFEATPGLIVQPGPENLFANVSEISATVRGATDDNFAHFEDFGNFESNSTVFRAAEQTSSNRNNKALSSKAASNVTMSKVDEGVDGNVAKLSLEERDTSNDSGAGKDNIDDDDSDFGDFVQAEVESKPETTMPSKKNVSMSAEANIMKTTKTGPFRTKSLVKKKVRIIVDNTWFCLKKIESQPGKIYFDGCLTKDSVVEEVSGSALGEYVFIVKGVEMTEDRRSSLAPIKAGEVLEGDNEIVGNSGAVEVGFDGVEVMNVWLKTLREQILQCQLSETE